MAHIMETPRVIRETNTGFMSFSIKDVMYAKRKVFCTVPIDATSADSLIVQLLYLAEVDSQAEIELFINTPGGEVRSGLAVYDTMQAIPCPIRTVCTGVAASTGSILFVAGDRRQLLPNSMVMIHDPLMTSVGGNALSVEDTARNLMKTRQTMAEILSRHTGRSVAEILEKTSSDTYFDAHEAIEFGLADEIVSHV